MSLDFSALDAVASERKSRSAKPLEEQKKHITFTVAEFNTMRNKIGKPAWTPPDFKVLLEAIADGIVTLALAKGPK